MPQLTLICFSLGRSKRVDLQDPCQVKGVLLKAHALTCFVSHKACGVPYLYVDTLGRRQINLLEKNGLPKIIGAAKRKEDLASIPEAP